MGRYLLCIYYFLKMAERGMKILIISVPLKEKYYSFLKFRADQTIMENCRPDFHDQACRTGKKEKRENAKN